VAKQSEGGIVRRTVTLSKETDKAVSFLIGEDGNYSEFVDRALRIHAQHLRIDAWLAEFEHEHGPIPKEVQAWADRLWRSRKKGQRRSRSTAGR
jgi:hypothetical protein